MWIIGGCALACTLLGTVVLLILGERGAEIANVLALPVAIAGTLFAASPLIVDQLRAGRVAPAVRRRSSRATTLLIGTIILLGAMIPLGTWWINSRYGNLSVDLGDSFTLDEGESRSIEMNAPASGWRGVLRFEPRFGAKSELGDCVLAAALRIGPNMDGQALDHHVVRHRDKVAIVLPPSGRKLRLDLTLEVEGNQGCRLDVNLADGTLDR